MASKNKPRSEGDGEPEQSGMRVPLGDVLDSEPRARSRNAGHTVLTQGATTLLLEVGRLHGEPSFFPWLAVDEGKGDGSYYLSPTNEDDPHKLPVRWTEGGTVATFSLRKLFKVKGISIPKGHNMLIPCAPGKLAGVGPALVLRFAARTIEPIHSHSAPAAGGEPTAQA